MGTSWFASKRCRAFGEYLAMNSLREGGKEGYIELIVLEWVGLPNCEGKEGDMILFT